MKNFRGTVETFNTLVQEYKLMEALDRFYDPMIISTDNSDAPTIGIEKFRKSVEEFMANAEVVQLLLLSTIIEENLSVAHWHYILNHKAYGRLDYKQISVQRWMDDKIIAENHFYRLS